MARQFIADDHDGRGFCRITIVKGAASQHVYAERVEILRADGSEADAIFLVRGWRLAFGAERYCYNDVAERKHRDDCRGAGAGSRWQR